MATPEERYAAIVDALVGRPGVTYDTAPPGSRRTFGSDALKISGKIFAMLTRGRFVVKLPRQRVDALVASGDGERFDTGRGRLMKEWLSLDPSSQQEWESLAAEAMEYVASRT